MSLADKNHKPVEDHKLSDSEKRDARRRSPPSAAVIFEAIRREAEDELERHGRALFWSGLAAGLSMGFSFIAEALLQSALPETGWRSLITKLGYSVGFLIVILGRQQLFTENTLTPVIHFLRERRMQVFLSVLRLWSIVLVANVLGTLMFGFALYYADVFDTRQTLAMLEISVHAAETGPGDTFVSAILAGWLIALMVWLLPGAANARVGIIILITYLVGIGGFSHIIAGSTVQAYGVAAGSIGVGQALGGFFLPTLAGNIIGGVAFVAVLNYAQVYTEE